MLMGEREGKPIPATAREKLAPRTLRSAGKALEFISIEVKGESLIFRDLFPTHQLQLERRQEELSEQRHRVRIKTRKVEKENALALDDAADRETRDRMAKSLPNCD